MVPIEYFLLSLIILVKAIIIAVCIMIIVKYKKKPGHNHFELLWMGSKIYTVEKILKDNRNNKHPLMNITSLNETAKLDKNYSDLLKDSTKIECKENFKKCGILDTYGNIMCLPNSESCPINEIIIGTEENHTYYLDKGYQTVKISELPENVLLYYTNESINNEIVVDLNFSEEYPKYIFKNNFIFDKNTLEQYI